MKHRERSGADRIQFLVLKENKELNYEHILLQLHHLHPLKPGPHHVVDHRDWISSKELGFLVDQHLRKQQDSWLEPPIISIERAGRDRRLDDIQKGSHRCKESIHYNNGECCTEAKWHE